MKKRKIELSIRLDLPGGTRFGPGKFTLLEHIAAEGSISAASKTMQMSYPRALRLVDEMNTQFQQPLIFKYQGGAARGGASLTEAGEFVRSLYRQLTETAKQAARDDLKTLESKCLPAR